MDRPDLELLRGAIDMHAHTGPALFNRHIDDAALAEYAIRYGMRGFVLKDHDASTTGRSYYVNRMYPEVESFGAVVLNRSVGGLDPYVAEAALHYGAKIVWMPSNHSKYHADFFDMPDYPQFAGPGGSCPARASARRGGRRYADEAAHDLRGGGGQRRVARPISRCADPHAAGRSPRSRRQSFIVTHANWSLCRLDASCAEGADARRARRASPARVSLSSGNSSPVACRMDHGARATISCSVPTSGSSPGRHGGLRMLLAALLGVGVPFGIWRR